MWLRPAGLVLAAAFASLALGSVAAAGFVTFESGQVRPLASSLDGSKLFAVNTPDGRLEIFTVTDAGLTHTGSVAVGMEPVSVAVRSDTEVWVVNHLSDSVSIVDVGASPPRVVRTLLVGDEPRDIVFAGAARGRAFITTAHRGQNSPVDPQITASGVGRADVWVFDAAALGASPGGDPLTIVTLFGDTPRALAASPDGRTVYAAVFHSGNQTTTVAERSVCDAPVDQPCVVDGQVMPGGLPPPYGNVQAVIRPEVGLIVKFDPATGAWADPVGRDWRDAIRLSLPDEDVFALDAEATPPVQRTAFAGVGTIIYGLAVNPATGVVYASNTEARNEVRFSGSGILGGSTVRGHQHESRISVLDAGGVRTRRLNTHIDYAVVPSPPNVKERSLALPVGMVVSADGRTLYVAAMGSSAIGVLDTAALEAGTRVPDAGDLVAVSGGGPTGLVLDEPRKRLYVLTRFDDAISVVDTTSRSEIAHVPLFDPEPRAVVAGRHYLYDARLGSSNGEASCGSCHVFGDFDGLAWDLGDPDGAVVPDPNPTRTDKGDPPPAPDFHPMKGPMVTQTLRGIGSNGPMHWRGDRTGAYVPGGDPFDERAAFLQFDEAFVSLLGNETPLDVAGMGEFADFALAITPPPNPIRNLDGSFTEAQQTARDAFFAEGSCTACHRDEPELGFFGTDGFTAPNEAALPQFMKIPHLDNLYQKLGMFERRPPANNGDTTPVGPQVRGFGYLHNGSQGFPPSGEAEFPFLVAFDAPLAPIVGQQITLDGTSSVVAASRVDLLAAQAALGRCDLVVKGTIDGAERGWVRTATGQFMSDRVWEPARSDEALRALAAGPGQELTYTCVPPDSGRRVGIDRDEDGALDGDERDAGSNPADAASVPLRCDGGSIATGIHLKITRRRGRTGGGTMIVRGTVTLPPPVDPLVGGFRLNLIGTNGRFLVARALPADAPGWRLLKAGRSWRYRDQSGTKLRIRRAGRAQNRFRFAGRFENVATPTNPADLGALVVALDGDERCARAAFGQTALKCRANTKRVECQ